MKLIEVQNITKKYANHTALKNVTFSIETGTIFGPLSEIWLPHSLHWININLLVR